MLSIMSLTYTKDIFIKESNPLTKQTLSKNPSFKFFLNLFVWHINEV